MHPMVALFVPAEPLRVDQAYRPRVSERFLRLADQLEFEAVGVRVEAVNAFGRLIRESAHGQQSVVEIVCTFVRVQAARAAPPRDSRGIRPVPNDLLAALKVLDGQPLPRERTNPDDKVIRDLIE
jgi:hypothetical protein